MGAEANGRVAVVTGGSRGIGRAIAQRLAAEGCDLLLVAKSEANLTAAAQDIAGDTGRRVEIAALDLRSLEACRAVHGALVESYGGIDILVNVAGATRAGAFLELEDSLWEDGFALKFYACVRLCRLFWPLLADRRGSVVNIVGGAARTPDPDFMIGGAVNAAMASFTKALAGQGLRDDVNVNAVYPGTTQTERVEELLATRARLEGITVEAIRQATLAREGIRRIGEPRDVASLVAFLCRPEARHIQGTAIAVDGGATKGLF